MLSRLEFFITETFLSFRRHPAMAFAATICVASALFVASLAGLAILNMDFAVQTEIDRLRISVFFFPETSAREADETFARIQSLPKVASAVFVGKDEAWAKLKKENPKLAAEVKENPYPDGVVVRATDVSALAGLEETISKWPNVHSVASAPDVSSKLETFREAVGRIGFVAGIILAVLALVIVHHTIELTLYARRKEIGIMTLVGATPTTVATPFLLEGMLYGVFGAGIALGCAWLLYGVATQHLLHDYGIGLLQDQFLLSRGALAILVVGVALGLFGSVASVTKYMRRPRSRMTNA